MSDQTHYHKIWNSLFPKKWKLGLFLIFLFGIPRFILVLQSNVTGQSQYVSIIFTLMMFTPLIFLKRSGRKEMGIRRSKHPWWLLGGFLLGVAMCAGFYLLFSLLFGSDVSNPFVYIGSKTFNGEDNLAYFIIYLAIVMTFSPIGEELFYRGVVHKTFINRFGDRGASIIDSTAFAITHLAHFGIIFTLGAWKFLPLPSIIWISSMFLTCMVFNWMKTKSGSIFGAILTHAGFNAGMGLIFYYL
jgi:membrane protease YdiL (CAAX protease family)